MDKQCVESDGHTSVSVLSAQFVNSSIELHTTQRIGCTSSSSVLNPSAKNFGLVRVMGYSETL